LVNRDSLAKIKNVVSDGYARLKETGDSGAYCIDRYWTKIQLTQRMLIFRKKLGFQRPSISKITGKLNNMLD
jgi:hypothetical protein